MDETGAVQSLDARPLREHTKDRRIKNGTKTLVIDLDRCIGCFACEVACKNENNVPLGVYYNKVLSIGPVGKFPELKQYFLPTVCQNCRDAPCVKVCPTGASFKTEDGQVLVDKEKCIGCKMCIAACPLRCPFL